MQNKIIKITLFTSSVHLFSTFKTSSKIAVFCYFLFLDTFFHFLSSVRAVFDHLVIFVAVFHPPAGAGQPPDIKTGILSRPAQLVYRPTVFRPAFTWPTIVQWAQMNFFTLQDFMYWNQHNWLTKLDRYDKVSVAVMIWVPQKPITFL